MVGREVRTAEIEPFAPERDDTPGMLEKNKMKLALIGVWIVLVLPGLVVTFYLYSVENMSCSNCTDGEYNRDSRFEENTPAPMTVEGNCFDLIEESRYPDQCKFFIEGVSLSTVCILGIITNLLSGVVLLKYQSGSTFSKLLSGLSLLDGLLLLTLLVDNGLPAVWGEPEWYILLVPTIYPIKGMLITATIYCVVVISGQRQRAIVQPLKAKSGFLTCFIFVIVLSVAVNLPKFLEFRVSDINGTYALRTTELAENKTYMKWNNYWDQLILNGFIPLLALVCFNIRIYKNLSESETKRGFMVRGTVHLEKTQNLNSQTSFKSMLRSKSLRRGNQLTDPNMFSIASSDPERGQSMLSGRPGENMERETNFGGTPSFRVQFNQLKRKRERSNLILLAIVLLFIFSHSFRILFKAIELTFIDNHVSLEVFNFCYEKGRYIIPPAWLCLSHVNHLFLVLNSALNFFLYCLVGRRFRQELQLCICRLIRRRRQNI